MLKFAEIKAKGWFKRLCTYAEGGGHLLSICGGYQMMGAFVHDPGGLEDKPVQRKGLACCGLKPNCDFPKQQTLPAFHGMNRF